MPDLVVGDGTPNVEAALALAAASAVTGSVRIGFSVLVVPLRPAPWLATQVATLQRLSGGRLVLGVGSGGFPGSPFSQALGVPERERGRITDATLDLLPRLLSGEPVEVSPGRPPLTPAPPAPMPPVLVGGSERAFRRVLDHGEGWFPSLVSPDALAPGRAAARPGRRTRASRADRHRRRPPRHGRGESARAAHDALVRDLVDVHRLAPEVAARTPMTARTPEELAGVFAAYEAAGADRAVTGADNGDWHAHLHFMAESRSLLDRPPGHDPDVQD